MRLKLADFGLARAFVVGRPNTKTQWVSELQLCFRTEIKLFGVNISPISPDQSGLIEPYFVGIIGTQGANPKVHPRGQKET